MEIKHKKQSYLGYLGISAFNWKKPLFVKFDAITLSFFLFSIMRTFTPLPICMFAYRHTLFRTDDLLHLAMHLLPPWESTMGSNPFWNSFLIFMRLYAFLRNIFLCILYYCLKVVFRRVHISCFPVIVIVILQCLSCSFAQN